MKEEKLFCKKRNEYINFPMTEDYCVDCKFYDILQNCWVNDLEVKSINSNVVEFKKYYEVYKTNFGSYCTDRKSKPIKVFFSDGQELDVSKFNVIIHDNGIEFEE